MDNPPTILGKILNRKIVEIASRQHHVSLGSLREKSASMGPARGFSKRLRERVALGEAAVIAEIKRASPSRGVIREDFDPVSIAISYARAGAACLSVLTDVDFFQGSDAHLTAVRAQTDLPVLRKDFVIDSYQLYESRVMGADCVLLIVSALQPKRLAELYHLARSLQMDVLIEVHDETELALALGFDDAIVGINNRNLHTFETSLETTYRLLDHIPPQSLVVTESGIRTRGDIAAMRARNVHTFLIGEAFMRSADPGAELAELVSG